MRPLATILLTAIALVTVNTPVCGQDYFHTQIYANRLYYNPAFAGGTPCPELSVSYRDHWPQVHGAYQTMGAAYQQQADLLYGGLGLLVSNDRQANGAIQDFAIAGIYAYHTELNYNTRLHLALQAGLQNRSTNWQNLSYADMLSPGTGISGASAESFASDRNTMYEDLAAGAVLYSGQWWAGLSAHHLSSPLRASPETRRAPMKFSLLGGYRHEVVGGGIKRGQLAIMPNILYQYQNNMQQLFYGVHVDYMMLKSGLWIRQNPAFHFDCIATMIGLSYKNISFAYSYDFTVSGLGNAGTGAHELSFSLGIICLEQKKTWKRAIKCPEI